MGIAHIIDGTIKNVLNKNKELFEVRIEICKKCKLYLADGILPPLCNSRLYLNPKTNETSRHAKIGFKRGCGCVLGSKTRREKEKCPLNKW